ncbi:hypothetical protein KYK29_10170 [Shinella daejeonensis]|uniref:hypothetical protein n=1 Tax=Shinella daejeonensis TaxID=659017 RepID=UPI0020C7D60B|nr:hypothetical protein [Shinella daejeonensis]MCP8895300.1 hypothetical protein [Shinella daejeonensis]
MTDAREIIAHQIPGSSAEVCFGLADAVIDSFHAAGLRILGPDEVSALQRAISKAEEGAGTLPAKQSVKLRPADWHALCSLVRALGRKA